MEDRTVQLEVVTEQFVKYAKSVIPKEQKHLNITKPNF
jgi:hypothetical protein